MTEQELKETTDKINRESVSPEEKTRRIETVKQVYANSQNQAAEAVREKQQTAEAQLKSKLQSAYMQNPVATVEDFERDYPAMKSDYLRGEAMKKDATARESMARRIAESF